MELLCYVVHKVRKRKRKSQESWPEYSKEKPPLFCPSSFPSIKGYCMDFQFSIKCESALLW